MSYNELSTNISHTSYALQGKLMAMLQTWRLLRGKKLTAGNIQYGKGWEEFDRNLIQNAKASVNPTLTWKH